MLEDNALNAAFLCLFKAKFQPSKTCRFLKNHAQLHTFSRFIHIRYFHAYVLM